MRRPDITVRRGESSTTRWQTATGRPGRHLWGVVDSYVEFLEYSASPVSRREIPGPSTVLIIELGSAVHAAGATETGSMRPVSAFVGCPGRGPALTWHQGAQHCVEVRLSLPGAYQLFGTMGEFGGRIVDLDSVLNISADRLVEQLVAEPDAGARFGILDQILGDAMASGPSPDPEVLYVWNRLQRTSGSVQIGELLSDTGWSRSRLAARFRAQTGLTPKAAASIVRLDRAAQQLMAQPNASLSSMALSCGYFDQAHFNRDFKNFAACTPREWQRAQLADLF
ncbi:AraC family transcriptional regulator [Williamsia muralis]|uniref:Helix-turn-helix domain-containing protein n=1 Tax=Williamsia marianensis TaxID=85044 RepID=A0ABU4EVG6_WILMA|nr:helix-turn-helix domain-containing protein [Williamsia muralis]MDV7135226.1 helix-turn-helix domain-containing protein [Williamsia muralis]